MSEDAKTFTQEDIDKLNEEHAQALKDLETRLKGETERKVDSAIKKTKAEIEVFVSNFSCYFVIFSVSKP